MTIPPLPCRWDGDGFAPLPGFARVADKHLVVGQVYKLVEHEERSAKSHAHFFACLNDAWSNLPEHLAAQFPSAEALRKYALIKAGYADSRTLVASSRAEAMRLAAFVRPMDEFAVVTTEVCVVTVYTAKSQSMRAMGRKEFAASKEAVLGIVAEMIGVTLADLTNHTNETAR